jgi:hypothetical protein
MRLTVGQSYSAKRSGTSQGSVNWRPAPESKRFRAMETISRRFSSLGGTPIHAIGGEHGDERRTSTPLA